MHISASGGCWHSWPCSRIAPVSAAGVMWHPLPDLISLCLLRRMLVTVSQVGPTQVIQRCYPYPQITQGNPIAESPLPGKRRLSDSRECWSCEPARRIVQLLWSPRAARAALERRHLRLRRKVPIARKTNLLRLHFPRAKTEQKILLLAVDISRENTDAAVSA